MGYQDDDTEDEIGFFNSVDDILAKRNAIYQKKQEQKAKDEEGKSPTELLCFRILYELKEIADFYKEEKKYSSGYATNKYKSHHYFDAKDHLMQADVFWGILSSKLENPSDFKNTQQIMDVFLEKYEEYFEKFERTLFRMEISPDNCFGTMYKVARIITDFQSAMKEE